MRSYGSVAAGEVLAAVVDHLVGAERPHEVELAGVVDAGHVRTEPLGELDRERARAASAPVDQHPTPDRGAVGSLQRDRSGLGDRRRLGERQLCRLVGERRLGRDRVLGEAALQREVVAVHLVTGPESSDALADGVDPPGDVRAERAARRRAQPTQARIQRRAAQALPVAEVDRRRGNLDEHLPGAGRRHRDVLDPQHVRGSVPVVDDRSHTASQHRLWRRPTPGTYPERLAIPERRLRRTETTYFSPAVSPATRRRRVRARPRLRSAAVAPSWRADSVPNAGTGAFAVVPGEWFIVEAWDRAEECVSSAVGTGVRGRSADAEEEGKRCGRQRAPSFANRVAAEHRPRHAFPNGES